MIKFIGGPAERKTLNLKRTPKYLRVALDVTSNVSGKSRLSALDQLSANPKSNQALYAYILVSKDGGSFIDTVDPSTSKKSGGFYPDAIYTLIEPQPHDVDMRNRNLWEAWTRSEHEKSKEQK